jgi:hypothetical protein
LFWWWANHRCPSQKEKHWTLGEVPTTN